MTGRSDASVPAEDQALLAELGETLDIVEAPPEDLVDRAVALFALRYVDAELLTMLTDSLEQVGADGLRGDERSWRVLSYRSDSIVVELEIDGDGIRMVTGQLDPPTVERVELFHDDASTAEVQVDSHGRFRVALPPSGSFRILATLQGGRRVITPVLNA